MPKMQNIYYKDTALVFQSKLHANLCEADFLACGILLACSETKPANNRKVEKYSLIILLNTKSSPSLQENKS